MYNIGMDFEEIELQMVDCVHLSQDRDRLMAFRIP
jgi:hypothetical protein